MLKKESKMAGRVNPNGPTRSRALLPPAMLGLGLLAAMAGQASAELGCKTYDSGTSNERSFLSDPKYCHFQELNAAFNGLLTWCSSSGAVRRMCSQMCTHHHPPTHLTTHTQRGQSVRPVAAPPTPPPSLPLFPPSSLCVNGKQKGKKRLRYSTPVVAAG